MKRDRMKESVEEWIRLCNARDLPAILSHYDDHVVVHSPKAAVIIGKGKIEGKVALRSHRTTALERIPKLRFTLDHFAWDEKLEGLFIVYITELNEQRTRACERMRFSGSPVIDSEGLYGTPV